MNRNATITAAVWLARVFQDGISRGRVRGCAVVLASISDILPRYQAVKGEPPCQNGWFMPKVRVPASSANLGPGFDALGLALGLYLECRFRRAEALTICPSGRDA